MQEVKLSQVKPNPDNPRIIKDYKFLKLVKSVLTFPEMQRLRPIVIDDNQIILGGNMRYKTLKHILTLDIAREVYSFGLEPERTNFLISYWEQFKKDKIIFVEHADNLTEAQKKEFIIKDNISFGENDLDILANNWDAFELQDWGLELPIIGDDTQEETKEKLETKEEALKPFKMTHILLSFSPNKYEEIKDLIDKILQIEGIEYEQGSN